MNKRQAIPYITLLIVFLIWLYLKPQENLPSLPEHHPSYIAYNLDNIHFDETGEIAHKIFASKTTNFSDKETTIFEDPKVIIYIKNEQDNSITTWQVTSKNGFLSGNNKLVLSDDVWVKNLSLDQLIQTMHTEKLTILLAEKEISSDLFVQWEGPQMKQQGIGMWASLISEELIIKKQIKAVYLNETK
ncbi:LPS export ABC transporter periplasmic protein LptC [Psychromonas hadalis]|uniref:LPS export ABC transporter periplasmic protein LptC n=1 Tax=Psychromonas hadalis TaxID=211669 RepID=UPI0003B50421|nr:LPS export ABC transporter periplasmic protein LptC [Psychromonas hadalis]